MAALALTGLLSCASNAQQTQTFSNYFSHLPAATTPLAGTEPSLVLQAGATRQTSVSNLYNPVKLTASTTAVSPNLASTGYIELTNTNAGAGGVGSQLRFGSTVGNPYGLIGSYLNDGTPPGAGYLLFATRNGSGGALTNHLFISPSLVGTLISSDTPSNANLIAGASANFSGYNRSGQQVFAGFSQTGDDVTHSGTEAAYFVGQNNDNSGFGVTAWGAYIEGRAANVQLTFGAEIDTQNLNGPPRTVDPYHQFGSTASPVNYSIWSQPNGTGAGSVFDSSAFMGITKGGTARFQKGIVFGNDSIATVGGHVAAVELASGQEIAWYSSGGSVNRASGDGTNITLTGGVIGSANMTAQSFAVGSSPGVSCAAGTVSIATLTITSGIVTHC